MVDKIALGEGRSNFICHLTKIKYMAILPETRKPKDVKSGCNIKSDFSFIKTKTAMVKSNLDRTFNIVIYFIRSIAWKNQSGNIICPGTIRNVIKIIV